MVIAIIAGLELFSASEDWRIRSVCNAAISQLVLENQVKVLHEDRLTAIWNLYFSLGSISKVSPIFPDRIVILNALRQLAPMYAIEDDELSATIVTSLLQLSNKVFLNN